MTPQERRDHIEAGVWSLLRVTGLLGTAHSKLLATLGDTTRADRIDRIITATNTEWQRWLRAL